MVNKVYFAESDDDCGGAYIAAPNIREAKKIARSCEIVADYMDSFLDFKIHMQRRDGKPVMVDLSPGEMEIDEIVSAGLAWWSCDECGLDHFKVDDIGDTYTCLDCGHTGEIPYAGR